MILSQQTTPTSSPLLHTEQTSASSLRRRLYGHGTDNNISEVAEKKEVERKLVLSSPIGSPETKLGVKEQFAKLEASSKCLLQTTMQRVGKLKQYSTGDTPKKNNITNFNIEQEELEIQELFQELKQNLRQMKSMSDDMSTLYQVNKNLSPRVVDQIKTWELAVDGLHVSLRKLTMDFQHILNSKKREDLLSLSRSPFENAQQLDKSRRGKAPGEISSNTTDVLARSRNILYETVQRSTATLEQLAQSSLTIVNSQEDLKEQNTVVSTSKKLLSKYGRREWTDRVLISLALMFFFTVVAYVVQKRVF